MSLAHDERLELAETMAQVGPDAPTLCGDWTVRDLAAHLVVRERRLDAAPGIFLPPLSGYTKRVQDRVAAGEWVSLVDDVRTGPPIWSPYKLLDAQINLGEMFVHHEDVRRADGSAPSPRDLGAEMESALWGVLGLVGRLAYREAPVTVVQETPDGRTRRLGKKSASRSVALRGEPSELLLHAFGRDAVVLEFDGDEGDIAAVKGLDRGF
ncbi:MAG: TIGR03085 family metal-binding protein [Rhodococcus sp. (in: high G+C Gram-positive bacteria)]